MTEARELPSGGKVRKRKKRLLIPAAVLLALIAAFLCYTGVYYHADETAEAALLSDGEVRVSKEGWGWFFDGPSSESALVFYPGAKVEETAYAPLCRRLAEAGMDVYLVKMPFRLAFVGANRAGRIIGGGHAHWYIGGHSLGGVLAAAYAAKNPDQLDGLILLASYSAAKVDDGLPTLLICGSEDAVLDPEAYRKNRANVSPAAAELVIAGGNHAQFGSYGVQKGDGEASVSPEAQQEETAAAILALAGGGDFPG